MSTLKVNKIEATGTTDGGIEIDSDGHVQVDGVQLPTSGQLSNRNLFMNGNFCIDQRNSGSATTPSGTNWTLDRFRILQPSGTAAFTIEQQTSGLPSGHTHGVKIELADNQTPSSSQQYFFGTAFECNNVGHLGFGTSSALTTTLSFWVRASVAGTYSISWVNDAGGRTYIDTYTINSANTWEHKTITISGDTGGSWTNSSNVRHSFLQWDLGAGSNFHGSVGWQTGSLRKTSGSVNFVSGTDGDEFYLTGIQLEVGNKATPFEHESYAQTLQKCLRYFFKPNCQGSAKQKMMGISYGANSYYMSVDFPVPMRVAPSVPTDSGGTWRSRTNNVNHVTSNWSTHGTASTTNIMITMNSSGTIAGGTPFWFETHDSSGCSLEFDAEF